MSEAPEQNASATPPSQEFVLSERQLFELAVGESITVDVSGPAGQTELTLSVEPPSGETASD